MPAIFADRLTKVFGHGETEVVALKDATLSGGEQQRLAVARAVVNDPAVILADEPTASLDTQRGKAVMDLLRQLGRERKAAVIAVTHDERMIEGFDRVYHMIDGRIDRSWRPEGPIGART
jgi:putative ABC transport system ATP-binding protein